MTKKLDPKRPWYLVRNERDAEHILGYQPALKAAWADGWNAAVKEYVRQLDEAIAKEQGRQADEYDIHTS